MVTNISGYSKLSIIIPCIEHADLRGTIESIDLNFVQEILIIIDKNNEYQINDILSVKEKISIIKADNISLLAACNKGIEAAKTKYFMFLMPGDCIEGNTLKDCLELFDKNKEYINLILFPQLSESEGEEKKYFYNEYECSGIYNTELEPYIDVKDFNFIIKKDYDNLCQFEEGFSFEIAYNIFVVKQIRQSDYFGFSRTKGVRHKETGNYSGLDLDEKLYIKNLERLFQLFEENTLEDQIHVSMFVQGIVLKILYNYLLNIGLFPFENKDPVKHIIANIADRIDMKWICRLKNIDIYFLYYLSTFKREKLDVRADAGNYGIFEGNTQIKVWKSFGFVIQAFKLRDDKLILKGVFRNPAGILIDYIPYIMFNDDESTKRPASTETSLLSYMGTKEKIAKFNMLEINIDLRKVNNIKLFVKISGYQYPVRLYSIDGTPFSGLKKKEGFAVDNFIFRMKKYELKIGYKSFNRKVKDFIKAIIGKKEQKANLEFSQYLANGKQDIILYVDSSKDKKLYSIFQNDKGKDQNTRFYCWKYDIPGNEKEKADKGVLFYGGEKLKDIYYSAGTVITNSALVLNYNPYIRDEETLMEGWNKRLILINGNRDMQELDIDEMWGLPNMDEVI